MPARKGFVDVSAKIIADISSGIYRTPANALKELISNSFDANARTVILTTDYPDFDVITCSDDGDGMAVTEFEDIMSRIGGTDKRAIADRTITGRPIIGKIGIGILAIAQICSRFTVISAKKNEPTRFEATIDLSEFHEQDAYKYHLKDKKVRIGEYDIEDNIPKEESGVSYTRVVLESIDSGFKRRLSEEKNPDKSVVGFTLDKSDPRTFAEFTEWTKDKRIRNIPEYLRLLWELAIISPVPYFEMGPVPSSKVMQEIKQRLLSYHFDVIVDGIKLRKPIILPYKQDVNNPLFDYKTYDFQFDELVEGSRLRFRGYMYHQNKAIQPPELRGILIRIREVGVGSYDKTLLNFPQSAGPIVSGITGEIYVEEGLETALNIDRNSFRETDPHYLALQEAIFRKLTEKREQEGVLLDARYRSKQMNLKKRELKEAREFAVFSKAIEDIYGQRFQVKRIREVRDRPVFIDTKTSEIVLYLSSLLPKKQKEKWVLEKFITFYELATMREPSKPSMDKLFYAFLKGGPKEG
jgi:hypothetical protein